MIPEGVLTAGEAWRRAGRKIGRQEARLLLEHVCACTHAALIAHPEQALGDDQATRFEHLVQRRVAGEPFAYLVGSAWFMGLEFTVGPAVLVPRPETELLVELATQRLAEREKKTVPSRSCTVSQGHSGR